MKHNLDDFLYDRWVNLKGRIEKLEHRNEGLEKEIKELKEYIKNNSKHIFPTYGPIKFEDCNFHPCICDDISKPCTCDHSFKL